MEISKNQIVAVRRCGGVNSKQVGSISWMEGVAHSQRQGGGEGTLPYLKSNAEMVSEVKMLLDVNNVGAVFHVCCFQMFQNFHFHQRLVVKTSFVPGPPLVPAGRDGTLERVLSVP
jgi:hypothetical protein